MEPKLEETIYFDFITSASDGAATDADSTPTAEVFEDATDTAVVALTVTKRTSKTGNYRLPVACTTANGFEANKSYNVVASATVGGVAAKAVVGRFQVRPILPDVNASKIGGQDATPNPDMADDVAAIKSKTDQLAFTTANKVDASATVDLGANAPSGWINASAFAQGAADKVWSTTSRILTAGTNIALAKGTGVTGFNDITAASVWGVARSGNQSSGTFGEYIDASVNSRLPTSSYSGDGVTLEELQDELDMRNVTTEAMANLDEPVSSRSEPGTAQNINLTQDLTDVKTKTVGGALHGSWASAFGRMVLDKANKLLKLWGIGSQSDDSPLQTWDVDNSDSPSTRTPIA